MEFVVATNNVNKLKEIRRILEANGHTVKSLEDLGIDLHPEELGETFADNALDKAQTICAECNLPTIADDSGLMVDIMDGAPGVHSARFAGNRCDDEANNRKLLQLLERTPYAKRDAKFVCVIAIVMPNGATMQVEGRCDGRIGFAASGENGFGYDALFYVNDVSFANMTDKEKDKLSHRTTALQRLMQELPVFLEGENGQPPV